MKSIKTKILLVVCLLVIISLATVGTTVSVLMYQSSLDSLEQTMSETAVVAGDLVAEYLATYKAVATEAGLVARLSNPEISTAEKQAILDDKIKQYGFLGGNVVDANGKGIISDVDIADRGYFKQAIKGEAVASEIVFGRVSQKYTINVAAPVYEGGKLSGRIVGVVYFNVDANKLSEITNSIQIGNTGSAYMLDKDNFTIAHRTIRIEDRDNTKESLAEVPALQQLADIEAKMTAGEDGFGIYSYKGVKKLVAYSPVPGGQGWSFAVTAELSEFIASTYNAILMTIILTAIAILVGILVSIILANSIARPIQEVEKAVQALSEGRLHDAAIDFTSKDEIGRLANSMRCTIDTLTHYIGDIDMAMGEMAKGNFDLPEPAERFAGEFASIEISTRSLMLQMSETLSQIMTASEQVSGGAEQVASGAQALSQGTTEQAASIEELSATISEISSQIKQTATNASMAREHTDKTGIAVGESNQRMQEMITAMNDINNKSTEISKIIKTIEDIAFQTNILALNAAVEAARAGVAGKGFAVVADEVRNLAGKSAEAAKNTTRLIEETVMAVDKGAKIADTTAVAMQSVVAGAGVIADLITEIANASNEQATAVTQVTLGVDQISAVIQTNSATSEESAAASEELSGQAEMLQTLVSRFNLRAEDKLLLGLK